MSGFQPETLAAIRDRFAGVDRCPVQGPRIFFENAGGALTLNSVIATSAAYAAIPDNQGRANAGAEELVRVIDKAKQDMRCLMNAPTGQFFMGESGTELLFRLITAACVARMPVDGASGGVGGSGGRVMGTTLEHPATRSACARWARIAGLDYEPVAHDDARGLIDARTYVGKVTPDTVVATIVHTSPVTGMGVDVAGIAAGIRKVAPDCLIIVDGIQHAAHGQIDIEACNIDGYVISPYKMFSRHGFGLAWISDRMSKIPHDNLVGGPETGWEMGTRDTGAYATLSDVHDYMVWLGAEVSAETTPRARIVAAGKAIHAHEAALTDIMIHGEGNIPGLSRIPGLHLIGGIDNPAREGLVSFFSDHLPAAGIVEYLNANGIRTHVRKNDHYSSNILAPLGQDACVRVSLCHYNSKEEVLRFLNCLHGMKGLDI